MKKIIFLAIALLAIPALKAQTAQTPVYFLFTSHDSLEGEDYGVLKKPSKYFDAHEEEYRNINFFIYHSRKLHTLSHKCKKNDHNQLSIYTKPLDFLDTVQYIDWDSEAINMTEEEVKAYIDALSKKERVYMIDKRDFDQENQTMKVFEARVYVPKKF